MKIFDENNYVAPAQAFPYQGSKRLLAPEILKFFPADTTKFIEPFAGSAAVSVAAKANGYIGPVEISDVNGPLIDLWSEIIDSPLELLDEYSALWHQQLEDPAAFFNETRRIFNETHSPSMLLYLLMRCVKAAVRYNKQGQFSQSADKRRLGTRPEALKTRILKVSELMQGTVISKDSYEIALASAGIRDLIYMDPPYQGTSNVPDSRYVKGLHRDAFIEQLESAVKRNVSFIISYDAITEEHRYGPPLPDSLGLHHLHLDAGRSAQGTLSGREVRTKESLYLSPALASRLND